MVDLIHFKDAFCSRRPEPHVPRAIEKRVRRIDSVFSFLSSINVILTDIIEPSVNVAMPGKSRKLRLLMSWTVL